MLGLVLVFCVPFSHAAEEYPRWSLSPFIGGHGPKLTQLREYVYDANILGDAKVLVYEGGEGSGIEDAEDIDENITEIVPFEFEGKLSTPWFAPVSGIEFQWQPNDRHGLIIGLGSWEQVAQNRSVSNLPLQQYYVRNVVESERRARLSYTEYSLGWRFNLKMDEKRRFYTRLGVHQLFDVDFREDTVFLFVESPVPDLVGVRRVRVVEAQTASAQGWFAGLGGEWFLRDWLSVGLEGGYLRQQGKFTLRHTVKRSDFLDTDEVDFSGAPADEMSDGGLGYLKPGTTADDVASLIDREGYYRPLSLSFDGWRFLARVSIYY